MQQYLFSAGDTSKTVDVFLPDSSSTTGAGLGSLVFNSSGLKCYYRKGATGTVTAITLATQTVGGAWSSGGFVETDGTNMKGMYRFDIPDTVIASAGTAYLYFYGATNLAPTPVQIQINAPVNVTNINSVATSSITTVNANIGTTQPVNFTGTGASALVKSDMVDIAGAAVSTSTAQLGVNVVNFGGSAGTFASGRPEVNTTHIAGSAVSTSTAQIGVNVVNFGGSAGTFSSGKPAVTLASTDVTGNVASDVQTIKTQTVTCSAGVTVSPFVGSTGAAVNGTNVNTLSSHDPGATLGTSTLTQAQVTGGAYALNSASFAFNAALDFTTTQKAATLARVTLVDTVTAVTGLTAANLDVAVSTRAPAATALSTVQWTNSLATDLGTTNSTVASNLDATITSRMATYTQPTGFLAATFPTTVASTTNITAGTITTVTNLTNAPTSGDFTATMKTSLVTAVWDGTIAGHTTSGTFGGALNSAGSSGDPWNTSLPGAYAVGTAGYIVGNNLDATISSRSTYAGGAVASVTAGVTVAIGGITSASVTGYLPSNVLQVNSIDVGGSGTSADPWGPA